MKKNIVPIIGLFVLVGQLHGMKKSDDPSQQSSPQNLSPIPSGSSPAAHSRKVSAFKVDLESLNTTSPRQIAISKSQDNIAEQNDSDLRDSNKRHSVRVTIDTDRPSSSSLLNLVTAMQGQAPTESVQQNQGPVFEFAFDLPDELSRMQPDELEEFVNSIVREANISTFGQEDEYCSQKLKKALMHDITRIKRNSKPTTHAHKNGNSPDIAQTDIELGNRQERKKTEDILRAAVMRRTASKRGFSSAVFNRQDNSTTNIKDKNIVTDLATAAAATVAAAANTAAAAAAKVSADEAVHEELKGWVLSQFKEREEEMQRQVKSERFKKYIGYGLTVFSTVGGIAAALITYFASNITVTCGS